MTNLNTLIEHTETLSLLYVEDHEQTRIRTVETLSIFFKNIIIAVDGMDGMEKFRENSFDLIITDINMPKLNGLEMLKKIRLIDEYIPIIIISAQDETNYFTKVIRFGIEAYLLKPFDVEDLIAVFQKTVEHILIKQELNEYKISLEEKVKEQVEELNNKNMFMVHQARLASMGEMINNIAHQWRQPLNRINSCVAVLNSIPHSNFTENKIITSKIKSIEKNTKYMSNTIEDFANFFHPNKVQTQFIVQNTIKKALTLIATRITTVNIIICPYDEVAVYSFENEYQQVLLSILHNAIDNFNEKDTATPTINITLKSDKTHSYLSIEDNGGGVNHKDINRIFEPYFTTKFRAEGTGLGLYMAKMIIESSMGGKLSVENKNSGACFEIKIPIGTKDA